MPAISWSWASPSKDPPDLHNPTLAAEMRRVRVKTKPFDILRGGENHLKRRRFVVVRRWRTTAVALQLRPSPSDSPPYSLAGAILKIHFVHRLTRRRNAASFLLSCPSPYDRAFATPRRSVLLRFNPYRSVPLYIPPIPSAPRRFPSDHIRFPPNCAKLRRLLPIPSPSICQ